MIFNENGEILHEDWYKNINSDKHEKLMEEIDSLIIECNPENISKLNYIQRKNILSRNARKGLDLLSKITHLCGVGTIGIWALKTFVYKIDNYLTLLAGVIITLLTMVPLNVAVNNSRAQLKVDIDCLKLADECITKFNTMANDNKIPKELREKARKQAETLTEKVSIARKNIEE